MSESRSDAPTFQVVDVTRAAVPQLAAWPRSASYHPHRWFGADRGPDSSLIQTGDVLEVVIWDNQENSLISAPGSKLTPIPPLTVSASGKVFLPYVGDVNVRGLTADAARDQIQTEMEAIVPAAQVQLTYQPGRNNSVDIASGVGQPGRYPLENRNTQLLSVLSIAGGIDTGLRHPRVRMQRGGQTYEARVDAILQNPGMNVRMRGGDQIAVVEDGRSFTAMGASKSQQLVYFEKEKMSALDAVASAGGLDGNRADPKGVLVLRDYRAHDVGPGPKAPDMAQVVFTLNLTTADGLFAARQFMIQPGDTVLATESPVTSVRTVAGLIGTFVGVGATVSTIAE